VDIPSKPIVAFFNLFSSSSVCCCCQLQQNNYLRIHELKAIMQIYIFFTLPTWRGLDGFWPCPLLVIDPCLILKAGRSSKRVRSYGTVINTNINIIIYQYILIFIRSNCQLLVRWPSCQLLTIIIISAVEETPQWALPLAISPGHTRLHSKLR
jgi:hypothetical protein